MTKVFCAALAAALLASTARPGEPEADGVKKTWSPAPVGDDLTLLLETLNGKAKGKRTPIHEVMERLERQLQDRGLATSTANRILERSREYDLSMVLDWRLEAMVREGRNVRAAELWLQCLRAHLVATTLGKGAVAIGRVVVDDGKLDPEMVLAQMPILQGGYFASEVGDLAKPIRFRAPGYEEVEVPFTGKVGPIVDVGTVVLKPLSPDNAGSLKAQLVLDIPERGPPTVKLSMMVPRGNMPYFGTT